MSGGVRLPLGLWPPASKGPQLGRTGAWASNRHHSLPACDHGRSFLSPWSLGSLVYKMGTMIPPRVGRRKGGHICNDHDTGPGAQNVHNKLHARMFQIALLDKVRYPIRMWRLPWKHRFLCTRVSRCQGDWPPLSRFLKPASVPPGASTNL